MKPYAFAAALLCLAPAAATSQPAKTAATDWTKRTAASTDGGFVMGNPNAKVTLVEYGSLTCPHCRHFAETALKPLTANYIRTGKVRFEFRNYILNGYDLSASVIARCGGASRFFPAAESFFATQDSWIDRIRKTPRERLQAVEGLPDNKKLAAMAEIGGFKAIAAAKGISNAAAEKCLADPAAAQRLVDMTDAAQSKYGVNGTPTFFVNGERVSGADWVSVEAALKAAL
jgi:protein-disulfide isomerase